MLDKGAARVDKELAREPAIKATLMDTLGSVYMGLGLYDQMWPLGISPWSGLNRKIWRAPNSSSGKRSTCGDP